MEYWKGLYLDLGVSYKGINISKNHQVVHLRLLYIHACIYAITQFFKN